MNHSPISSTLMSPVQTQGLNTNKSGPLGKFPFYSLSLTISDYQVVTPFLEAFQCLTPEPITSQLPLLKFLLQLVLWVTIPFRTPIKEEAVLEG